LFKKIVLCLIAIGFFMTLSTESIAGPTKKIIILPLVNKINSDVAAVAFIYRRANYREYIGAVQSSFDSVIKQKFPATEFKIVDNLEIADLIKAQGYDLSAFDMPDKETLKAIAEASQANLVIAVEASNLGTCFVPYHTGRSPWFLSCLIRSYDSSTKKYLTRYFNHTDTFGSGERGGDINGAITKIATQTFELALQK